MPDSLTPLKTTVDLIKDPRDISSLFIILEIIMGCTGGIIYINLPGYPNEELNESIIKFYLMLNGIFFFITIFLGIVSSIFLKKLNRLFVSIVLSLVTGMVFIIFHVFVLPVPLFAFFSLFGFILGFNFYLLKESEPEVDNFN